MSDFANKPETKRGNPNWVKGGSSPNPTGRPRSVDEFRLKARAVVDELVLQAWEAEVRNMGDNWLKASELLAAYGYGKPTQGIEVSDVTKSPAKELTADDLRALAK